MIFTSLSWCCTMKCLCFDECVPHFCSSRQREGQVEAGVMTTSTHTGEEKKEEIKGVSVSNSAVLRDPEHRPLVFPIPHSVFFPRRPTHPPIPTWKRGYLKQGPSCLSVNQPTQSHLTFSALALIFLQSSYSLKGIYSKMRYATFMKKNHLLLWKNCQNEINYVKGRTWRKWYSRQNVLVITTFSFCCRL